MKLIKMLRKLLGISAGEYSAVPEADVKPQIQPVETSTTIDESEPDDDGWQRRPNGERFRRIKHGGMGSGMFEDDYPQSNNLAIHRPNRR